MRRVIRIVIWILGGLSAYLLLASLIVAFGLGYLLSADGVDWAGYTRPRPADPLTIGYHGDPKTAFGYAFETVSYPTELGAAEAWVLPAAAPSDLWAIWVHGIGGVRENGYRIVKTLHEAGVPVLMITYRNDREAPPTADRLYSFGLSEWPDVEAAVEWLVTERGAGRVVIAAESMGAAITGQYLQHGGNTDRIAGVALDAPALDFPAIVYAGGKRYWVPLSDVVASAALTISSWLRRDLREAVGMDAIARFEGPIFLAHGSGDPLVPYAISERLLSLRPEIVFLSTDADRHPMSFESNRDAYTARLREWLALVVR